jgi:hypothetical protein
VLPSLVFGGSKPMSINRKVYTNQFRGVTIRVAEFITIEKSGFVANILDAHGQFIDYSDENPKPLQEAKLLGCDRASSHANGVYRIPEQIMEDLKDSWTETSVPHDRVFG